ncbi:plasmid replication protein, CyRepA1 family [Calothrix sp. FACHB-168]|uniref:plasmid replication protein, CyRepA1 family n=1 Tax=Calothrix sp. FACHB-168 TaxID=2692780 RepID=UPI001684DCE5|nr:plasmid replication protein, CyRepA1 family [Calothrix sp. FACHB-168]MBD2208115.1 DUF3854 domain-containing protein [Calothrix sp. FACHB-168]
MAIKIKIDNLKRIKCTTIVPLETTQTPLQDAHLKEWLDSGVDESIILLNVQSIAGQQIIDFLNISDLNKWQLNKQYGEVLKGGWICDKTFKANKPRLIKQKPIKYENPKGLSIEPILLDLPEEIWQKIADKYGIHKPEDLNGWEWVEQNPQIPVAIAEGVKKAGSIITSQLIPTIALPGHTSAYEKDGDVRFKRFLDSERLLYICFDNDLTTSARASVASSIKGIIKRLCRDKNHRVLAKPRAVVKVCHWEKYKGIDDVLMQSGISTVDRIFKNAINWDKWVDDSSNTLGFAPAITFNSNRFEFTELHPEATLIGIKGRKGSGKTWYMEQLVLQAKNLGRPIISIVHRIQLAVSNAKRLGITYIDDVDGKVSEHNSISLVIDSLAKINVSNFEGGLILIDEVVQVVEHLMTSETCKNKREKILKKLSQLAQVILNTGGHFVLADADLNEFTIRFFIGLLGDSIEPYIIHNEYCEESYTCYISEGFKAKTETGVRNTPTDVIASALTAGIQGKRVMVCLTGQDEMSKWGTINVEKLFLSYGISNVIRIDSETTKNPDHPAYKATSKINILCDTYQIIIGSPSICTGVSIENKNKFDLVVGVFTGVGVPDATRQFLMRLRDISIPRLIWVAERGVTSAYTNLGTSDKSVEKRSSELFEFNTELLRVHDAEWSEEYPEIKHCNTASAYFNRLTSTRNTEVAQFKKYVLHGLNQENARVIEIETSDALISSLIDYQTLWDRAEETKLESLETYRNQLEAQTLIDDEDYAKLKNQTDLTDDERLALEAKIIFKKYGEVIPVTEDLITKNAQGWYEKIRLHYAATVGFDVIKSLQLLSASTQINISDNNVIRHDFNDRQRLIAQCEFIRESGLLELLEKSVLSSNDDDCVEIFEHLLEQRENINLIFGVQLKRQKTVKFDFQVISTMFNLLAITCTAITKKVKGKMQRVYTINTIDDKRDEIFQAWLTRDIDRAKNWEEYKHEWEVKRLVAQCTIDIDKEYLEALQAKNIFNEAWERVDTLTRITLINRADNFELPIPTTKEINPDAPDYQEILTDIATWQEISLDIETYGLDSKNKEGLHARKGRIRLIQISNGETIYYVDLGGRKSTQCNIKLKQFLDLLNKQISKPDIKIIGQNVHFDLRFLRFQLGFDRPKNAIDTMLGAKVFFGDYGSLQVLTGGYGLGNLAARFLGLPVDKTEQKSDWGATLTTSQIDYAVKDPFITYHLYKRLLEVYSNPAKFGFGKLAQDGLLDAWQLENDIIPCAIELEYVGLPFDEIEARKNLEICKKHQNELLRQWYELVPDLNYTQTQKLAAYLNEKYNLTIKSLNKTRLAELKNLPEIELLGKLRAIKVPIQQLEALLKSAAQTGRVQTVFNTLTGTGRFSSGNSKTFKDLPNLQSISAKANTALKEFSDLKPVRTCISVSGNRGLGIVDLAASHGRIAADVADDETAIAGCNDESIDNHSKVAVYIAKALGHDVTWEEIAANKKIMPYKLYRDAAKNTYYGWLNGAGAKRVQEQIKANSGQDVVIEACIAAIEGCEALYPNVVNFRRKLIETLGNKKNLLHVDGKYYAINKIASVNNRITHLVKVDDDNVDLPYTQCLAAIWSRTEATALKRALIQIIELADNNPEWELKAINYVHDEINVEFNIDHAESVLTAVNNIIGDCFAVTLNKVSDGRETNWKKLLVNNWSEK